MRSFLVLSVAMSLGCSSAVVSPPDTGAADTGVVDTGAVDTGAVDTGAPDTGAPDTGAPDVTPQDAVSIDRVDAADGADVQDVPQDLSRLDLTTVPDQGVDAISVDVVPAMDAPTDSRADVVTADAVDVATATDTAPDAPPDVADVPPADVGCPAAGQRLCGGVCVNTATDPSNCGACGNACCAGQACSGGACAVVCAAGMTVCVRAGDRCGACVDTQTDPMNCGACGNACPAGVACRGGSCLPCGGCPTGSTCCGGACVDTRITNAHCGACDRPCCAGNVCSAGACFPGCTAGLTACPLSSTTCSGGTCNNLQTDANNCGVCGRSCAPGDLCVAGACQASGFMALAPCTSPSDYTAATTVRFGDAVGLAYSPRCVTVRAGEAVTWQGSFAGHPLAPATSRGSAGNPIPSTSAGTSVTVTFPAAGFFPYYCAFHGSSAGSGMAGVVQVVP